MAPRVKPDETPYVNGANRFKTETLSPAMRNETEYSRYFDINGNCKRLSVLRGNFEVAYPFRGGKRESICRTKAEQKFVANLWTEFAAQHDEALAKNGKELQNP